MASMSSERWDCTMEDMDLEIRMVDLDVPEIDDALLMQLLEDTHANDAEDERLGYVIQSLEAEIAPAGPAMIGDTESATDPLDMEAILSELDSHDGVAGDPFYWVGMEAAPAGYGMGGWPYMEEGPGEVGMGGFGEPRDFAGFAYGEYCSIEQVYSPLWQ